MLQTETIKNLPYTCPLDGRIARAEWGIENGLHDRRDVSLHEDASRVRRGCAPWVLAALNNAEIAIVLQTGERNLAAAQRRCAYQFERCLAYLPS